MLKFLKNILGPKKETGFSIGFGEIPAWVDDREREAREILAAETADPVLKIRNAAANLQLIVNNLKGAEHDPETHPKIKTIAKNSLPLFLKAMNTSLAKELPEDTDGFYTAAVEMVKGCLNAMRGQGRYLVVALPAEMKETKTGIDLIGHEINVMTGALGKFKNRQGQIEAARHSYGGILDSKKNVERSIGKEARGRARITEITNRLNEIATEIAQLSVESSAELVAAEKARCAELESQREALLRTYSALSMTASHVFRKAEKIANRKRETTSMHALKNAIAILSDHHIAAPDEIANALATAYPIAQKQIEDDEIALKNREERAMFSDTTQFSAELASTSLQYHEIDKTCEQAAQSLASHPVITRMNSLERESAQLRTMLTSEEKQLNELLEWREKTNASIPGSEKELAQKLSDIAGEPVEIAGAEPVTTGE